MKFIFPFLLFLFSLSSSADENLSLSEEENKKEISYLPSLETKNILKDLKIEPRTELSLKKPIDFLINIKATPINRLPKTTNSDGTANIPFIVPNSVILKFIDGTAKSEIESFLKEKNARIVSTQENIGTVQIETNLDSFFKPKLTDNSKNDALIRGLIDISIEFKKDPIVDFATPDLLLQKKVSYTNLVTPTNYRNSSARGESIDWGIKDIGADKLWSEPGASDGITVGVMDAGFNRHEDIVFTSIPTGTPVDDHGNHVSGIICAKHNGLGVRGVLPNCFIRPKSAESFKVEPSGQILEFVQSFGQTMNTLNEFIPSNPDIKAFNISLGYNWIPNFALNPDDTLSDQWRTIVGIQGEPFISVLKLAKLNNKAVIFSAAGNDSSNLADPIDAKFASPMNWAAITARERGITNNGLIVEAHDSNGIRAGFSNEKGHISCPGVDILSSVAFDNQDKSSTSHYATLSGTSMASPYCTGGYSLLSLILPKYSADELLTCIFSTATNSSSGTPMMNLEAASNACKPK